MRGRILYKLVFSFLFFELELSIKIYNIYKVLTNTIIMLYNYKKESLRNSTFLVR